MTGQSTGGCQLVFCEYDGDNALVTMKMIAMIMVRTGIIMVKVLMTGQSTGGCQLVDDH